MKRSMRIAALAALVVVLQLPDSRTGFFPADEGWLNNTALRLSQGEILYRDIASYLPPLTYWLLEAGMRIRPTLLWGRLLALVMCGAMTFAALRLLPGDVLSMRLGALFLALLYAVGFPSYSIPSYTGLSLTAGFLALNLFLQASDFQSTDIRKAKSVPGIESPKLFDGQRPSARSVLLRNYGLAAGFMTGMALLFKQTTGAALLFVLGLLLFGRGRRRHWRQLFWRLSVGFLLVLLPAIARIGWQGALPDFVASLSPASLERYRGLGAVALPGPLDLASTNLRYTMPFLVDLFPALLGHATVRWLGGAIVFLLYYLPLPLCLFAFFRRRDLRPLALFSGVTYLTLFPRADLAHLFQVLPGTAVVLAALVAGGREEGKRGTVSGKEALSKRRGPSRRFLVAAIVIVPAVLFLHGFRAAVYDVPLGVPRDGGIKVRSDQQGLSKLLSRLSRDHGPLLAVPWGSIYYFLADRPNPTRYELLLPGNIDAEGKAEVLRIVRQRPPSQLVWSQVDLRQLTPVSFDEFFPDLVRFRDRHYEKCLGPVAGEELYCLKQ